MPDLAEKLGSMIVSRLGTTPDQVREFVGQAYAWLKETHANVIGAKAGFQETVRRFDDRLDAIEARLESIHRLLKLEVAEPTPVKPNGLDHERSEPS